MPQTYEVTAPNGKTLSIEGDHVPSEAELNAIFKAAGVDVGAPASDKSSGWPATIADVGIGAAKRVMRAGQQIGNLPKIVGLPGLAEGTDKVFGLAPGTSWGLSEPSNTAQQVGSTGAAIAGSLAATAAMPTVIPAEGAGNFIEDAGTNLQRAVDRASKSANKGGGAMASVLKGKPVQGIMAAITRPIASISAKGLETVGQFIADDPNAAGKLAEILDAAKDPALTLGAPQTKFITDVTNQLASGKALSGAQRGYITAIYRAIPK